MKRFVYIFLGMALGFVLGFLAASGLSQVHDRYFATQGDLTTGVTVMLLGVWFLFTVTGGWVGHRLHRRVSTKPSA